MGTISGELHEQVQAICLKHVKACAAEMATDMAHISSTPAGAALAAMQQMIDICAWSIGSSVARQIQEAGDFGGHDLEAVKNDVLGAMIVQFDAGAEGEGNAERLDTNTSSK